MLHAHVSSVVLIAVSPRHLHSVLLPYLHLSGHPVLPTARQLLLPRCGGQIPCALPLRTLAPWPRTILPYDLHASFINITSHLHPSTFFNHLVFFWNTMKVISFLSAFSIIFFFYFDAAAAKRLVFVWFSLFSVLFATAHTFRAAALSFVHVCFHFFCRFIFVVLVFCTAAASLAVPAVFAAADRVFCCCRLFTCFALLQIIFRLSRRCSHLLHCCSSLSFSLASSSFSSTLLLLFSFSSLFLFRILKGTSPSTFRSFCLPPPAPFAFSLSLFLSSVSSMSILMHIGTSPATCLNFCLPPPFPFFHPFPSLASVFAVF